MEREAETELLAHAGRLLLEYNESTGAIHRALAATAGALTDEACHVAVSYGGVAVSLAGEAPVLLPVRELRYNTAVQARVHAILEQVRRGEVDPAAALARLRQGRGRHAAPPALGGRPGPRRRRRQPGRSAGGGRRRRGGRRPVRRAGPAGPAGARPAALQRADAAADRRLPRCRPRRPGHPARLDPDARTRPDRPGPDAGARAAPDQRGAGPDRQPSADEHGPPGAGDGHPAGQRPGDRPRGRADPPGARLSRAGRRCGSPQPRLRSWSWPGS